MSLSSLISENVMIVTFQTVSDKSTHHWLSWISLKKILFPKQVFTAPMLQWQTLQMKVKEHTGIWNFSINMLNNNSFHCYTSLKVGVYEKCPEDKKRPGIRKILIDNLHPEIRYLITLIIISAYWAELLVVIKLPNCFLNSTIVFDSVTSLVNEFHRLTIHMHKALFTSISFEFTAHYFYKVSPCPYRIMEQG